MLYFINAIVQIDKILHLDYSKTGCENMAIDYSIIGQRIKKARKAKSLTQEQLAEKIDVSIAFLSRIERGNSQINLKRLNQICEILGVTEVEILNGVSNNSSKYLNNEFSSLLKDCSSDKQKLIYDLAKVIAEQK